MRRKRSGERGSAIIELALVIGPLVLLMMGVVVLGLNLGRSLRCAQLCRATNSMYMRGLDFSKDGNKDVVVRIGQGLGLQRTGGRGVVILSRVTWIPQSRCTALNLNPCNGDRHVITQRLVIGNPSARPSALGTPAAALVGADGNVSNYMQNATAVATLPRLQLRDGELAYVAETYFPSPDLDMPGFYAGTGVYARAMY